MIAVEGIAASAEIVILSIWREHIVNIIIKAFKTEEWTVFISLSCMVKHHIQKYFDTIFVQFFDQSFQFIPLMGIFVFCGVTGVGGEKTYRIVTPVIQKFPAVHFSGGHCLVKFKNGHQFHMLEAVASENGARMTAMDSATNNAEEMLGKLEIQYNRARQGSITQELTEIIAGANAIN